ncbi:MAG: alpha-galactosidase [Defluviitaleaceae bacterium]|nr:alpha-galactosidase [Defluviitaleaceae bacterium]
MNLKPIMGWSTWNKFRQNISEKLILEQAEAMKNLGLLDAGYNYINLDDCWQASQRSSAGELQFDVGKFPSKDGFIKILNEMGFKVGIYSSSGQLTCEDMPGSYGNEKTDAATFVKWGIEYLKYDYCHVVDLPSDPHYDKTGFATEPPPILYIAAAPANGGTAETAILAENAQLTEPAFLQDGKIMGLNCTKASAQFTVTVPTAGEYQIAVGYDKKYSVNRQFILLTLADGSSHEMWFPPSSGWYTPARATINIPLNSGENILMLTNPISGQKEDTIFRYSRMGNALKAAQNGVPVYFSICEHGRTAPWTWAANFAQSWRVSHDIAANWATIMSCYETAADLWQYQKPGTYNDPDMLEVGVGNTTDDENLSHFALWCMMSAPLILGMDIQTASQNTLNLIKNPELIAINQDSLMLQASRIKMRENLDCLIKPLSSGNMAICLFNKSDKPTKNVEISPKELRDSRVEAEVFQNLHNYTNVITNEKFSGDLLNVGEINPHGVVVYRCS